MPRFVVLTHDHPGGLHWDFMLEMGRALATWALAQPPNAAETIPAEALPDHRPKYLDYEGPISGDRGSVTRWDRGTYQLQRQTDAELVARLTGKKLIGRVTLARLPGESRQWQFSFTSD